MDAQRWSHAQYHDHLHANLFYFLFDIPAATKVFFISLSIGLKDFDFPARAILYLLSFSGFLVSFMMRTDINLAIVAMVDMPPRMVSDDTSGEPLYCYTIEEPAGNGSSDVLLGPSEQVNQVPTCKYAPVAISILTESK